MKNRPIITKPRHARLTLTEEQLDELHALKRKLSRERGRPVTLDEVLGEGAELRLNEARIGGAR